jgi:aspartate aminotransferase-like enzyme
MISHRSSEFRILLGSVLERLRPLFGTDGALLPFTASGTGGLEAAVQNCVPDGGRVLAVSIGHFGDRFAEAARSWGAEVVEWRLPWGRAADADELRERLRAAAPLDAVLVTHNETSTGVLNPLPGLARAVREESEALLLVDAVSSVGATELEMDTWGVDVAVAASQKALMAPPGLVLLAAGERALRAAATNDRRRLYFDFARMIAAVAEGTTTYTPAVSVVYALDASLDLIHDEGLAAVFERHRLLARHCRARAVKVGLSPCAPADHTSPSLTALALPAGASAGELRRRLRDEHGVVVSQGRGPWKESVLRIGHMGYVRGDDLNDALGALEEVTREYVARRDTATPVEADLRRGRRGTGHP